MESNISPISCKLMTKLIFSLIIFPERSPRKSPQHHLYAMPPQHLLSQRKHGLQLLFSSQDFIIRIFQATKALISKTQSDMLYRSILLRFYWQASFSVATLEPDHNTRAKNYPVTASQLKASGCWREINTEKRSIVSGGTVQ